MEAENTRHPFVWSQKAAGVPPSSTVPTARPAASQRNQGGSGCRIHRRRPRNSGAASENPTHLALARNRIYFASVHGRLAGSRALDAYLFATAFSIRRPPRLSVWKLIDPTLRCAQTWCRVQTAILPTLDASAPIRRRCHVPRCFFISVGARIVPGFMDFRGGVTLSAREAGGGRRAVNLYTTSIHNDRKSAKSRFF